jgi:4-hydroxybenzoate polyprenyltransferase
VSELPAENPAEETPAAASEVAPAGLSAATRQKGALGTVRMLLELVKFEHSIFALPYAYVGAIYGAAIAADRWPTWQALLWITVAMVGARSFAFVVNRAVDKEIDARNPRTAGRAVPAGIVKAWELWLFSAVVLAAYLFAAWQLAPICRVLSPIPLAAFLVYPYLKRFTPLCHYWLGVCLGLAAPAGWVAVGAPLSDPAPWVFGVAVAIWTAGFDMIYSTQDVECDRRDGLHSMPADFGVAAALTQTRVLHAATAILFVVGGYLVGAGWAWYVGVAGATALLVWENAIISPDDLSRLDAAFFTTNGVIAVILLAGAILDRVMG